MIKNYLIKTLNGMAQGLFASLIIGLILKQIGSVLEIQFLIELGQIAQYLMGPAIGAAVAYSVKASPLGIFSAMVVGGIGAGTFQVESGLYTVTIGEPLGAFVAALIGAEASKLVAGKSKVDIIVVPLTTLLIGGIIGVFLSPYIASLMKGVGQVINTTTQLHPIPMGILVAILMGMNLTLPISSAAIAISLGLSGVAAGASLIGCSTQMIGFAVISYKANGFGGFLAQGFGTSMLQVPNIIKKPVIWLPPILASGILGPIGAAFIKMESNAIGAGMGTSGLVGQFGTFAAMGSDYDTSVLVLLIGLMHFILPGILSFIIYAFMKKKQWIKSEDYQLNT